MSNWQGTIAALGGIISLLQWISSDTPPVYATIGGLLALFFGMISAYSN